ncbi:MAG: hypothetical protein JXD19_09025 [Deltaproteobacteria bacterium]|nr:hypothetical protein [Deltaproteobacteria bacterium]
MLFLRRLVRFMVLCCGTILFFVSGSGSSAQGQDRLDGYWWDTVPYELRLGFILGYQEGFKMALGEIIAQNELLPGSLDTLSPEALEARFHLRPPVTCNQIAEKLDGLYRDSSNKPISISSAIIVAIMKAHNESEETIRQAIADYRNAETQPKE